MKMLCIKLTGNVAFENRMKMTEGFRYDIPIDSQGIPFIPVASLLPEEIIKNIRVGYAFPEGYDGYLAAAHNLVKMMRGIAPQIRSIFTEERYYPEEGCWIRSLKAGQTFLATVHKETDSNALAQALQSVRRIGIQKEGISGEVKCSLIDKKTEQKRTKHFPDNLTYEHLTYTVTPLTPVCIYAPYADGVRTMTYIPGRTMREELEKIVETNLKTKLNSIRFSNAYISDRLSRLLPVPLCMSLVKLEKTQLHYRLAPGKDSNRTDQDVTMGDAYTDSFENPTTVYTKPETERITSRDGVMYDALCPGQMFRGIIYGENNDLRELAHFFLNHPLMFLGNLSEEGFGEVYVRFEQLHEKKIDSEHLVRSFDVSCLSPTLILNDVGIPDTSAGGFSGEIERILDQRGNLKVIGRYMDVYMDSAYEPGWGQDGAVVRCLAKGSVMRLASKDGTPIDISPILHTYIGERTRDGYGEIMAYPALGTYYRAAELLPPEKYTTQFPSSRRTLQLSVDLTGKVLNMLIKNSVQYLAFMDRDDQKETDADADFIPMELLRAIRDRYSSDISDRTLAKWYLEGLEEDRDGFFSV
mgnify:CR=1 FL=1